MFHRASGGGGDLSVLARGRGLVGGGVEIECFADDRKAFTLTGQSFLLPADSDAGKHAKPYRAHKLALPKTYITKRGPMVLFTSPDDMVIGRSCQVHQREVTSKQAARELRTTENLVNTALNYKSEKDSSMISGDVSSDVMQQCPGSFTNVYLQSLQLAAQKAKQAQVSEDCVVEDIEGKDATGGPLVSDCDSGLGPSSGRISALSHHSDSTVITIPDGRESRLSVPADLVEEVVPVEKAPPTDSSTALSLLKSELTGYMPQAKEKSGKKKVTKVGKRQRVKSEEQKTAKVKRQTAMEHKKTESETSKSKQKSRRKRGKKDKEKEKVEASISLRMDDSQMVVGENGLYKDEGDILTAVQIPSSVVGEGRKEVDMRARRAEERRLEVERKRAEKRELELQKQREEEEKARLQEELRRAEEERLQREAMAVETGSAESDHESEETPAAVDTSILSRLEEDGFADNRLALLAEQEEARLRERRLLLAYAAEREEERRRKEMEEAEEELRKARELEEAIERKKREQEEQEKEERRKEEAAARAKAAMEKAEKLRKEQNYKNHFELASQRRFQSISRSFVFSYFNYVPPSRPKGDKKGKRTRQRPTRKK